MSRIIVEIWIILSTGLFAGGWVLSFFGAFSKVGFGILLLILFGIVFGTYRQALGDWRRLCRKELARLRVHIRKVFPLLFLVLAGMSLVGGLLYPPGHIDASQYRIPRLLHWIAEGRWHWITTPDPRMNAPAPGGEFLLAPVLLFANADRLYFFYNILSYLLLPGLLFSVFRRIGVKPGTAWTWMWIVPTGYCYVMQAGSLANDSYAAVYTLAAIDLAFRARSRSLRLGFLSILAMAAATGAKQTNAILGLPWLIAFGANWRFLFRAPGRTAIILAVAALASFIPISILNAKYAGDWRGFHPPDDLTPRSALWGIIGNCIALPAQNFQPPVCPWVDEWNEAMRRLRESELGGRFEGFEMLGHLFRTPSDQTAALGFAVCGLLLVSTVAALFLKCGRRPLSREKKLFHLCSWLALVVAMAKLGSTQNGRYLAPLYPLLMATLLLPCGHAMLSRRFWWRALAVVTIASTALVIATSRQRPLFPVLTISSHLMKQFPDVPAFAKIYNAYAFFPRIEQARRALHEHIPAEERNIGYLADIGLLEPALWRPAGQKRVFRLTKFDTVDSMRERGIRYVVLDRSMFRPVRYPKMARQWRDIDEWLAEHPADVIAAIPVPFDPQTPLETAYVVKLKERPAAP